MTRKTLHSIKDYLSNCEIVIELLVLPIFILFIINMAKTSVISSSAAKQLNLTFINTVIEAYTWYVIPIVSIVSTFKIILEFDDIEKALMKITFSAITEFITVVLIIYNFQISIGVEVIDIDTGVYYTATSMIEFIAISFIILGGYILYTKIKKHINKECNDND